MGVPGFNSWFAGNHRHAYVSRLNRSWDHVYIDMASILHAAMKKSYNLPHFHKVLFARLDSIMALASPRKSVMFALDGPAPLAKLLTQRKRRARESIKSAASVSEPTPYVSLVQPWLQAPTSAQLLKQRQQPKVDKQSSSSLAKSGNVTFPANKKVGLSNMGLTPGTPLMAEIERSLEFYICQRLQRWKHLTFELSGARVQGEGETKIMRRINSSPKGSHVIVGNDSDIILMSMMCPVKQLYILAQHTQGKSSRFNCISLDALDLPEQGTAQESGAAHGLGPRAFPTGLRMDLVLCAIIAKGNDYLPAVRGAGGPVNSLTLWKQYLKLRKSPQWSHQNLVIPEPGSQRATLNADLLIALLSQGGEYSGLRDKRFTPANLLPPDAKRYAQGLIWVLNMYLKGECSNYRWTHDNEAPSMHQLVEAIKALRQPQPQPQAANTGALLPSVCGLCLLPPSGREFLPQALRHLMDEGSPVADVFTSCDTCDHLAAENVKVTAAYMKIHAALTAATDSRRASRVLASSPPSPSVASGSRTASPSDEGSTTSDSDLSESEPDLLSELHDPANSESEEEQEEELKPGLAASQDADIQQMQQQAQALRAQMNSLRHQKESHLDEAHPYAPFPTDRLEQAVASVPSEAYSPEEQELNRFGQSHAFTWASDARSKAQSSSAELFIPQVPTGLSGNTPLPNILRKPIIESSVQRLPYYNPDIVASRQSVLVQSLMQQQQCWQMQPLSRGAVQRQAVQAQHTKSLQLSRWGVLPRLQSGGIKPTRGLWRNGPRSSLLSHAGLQRLCVRVLTC